MLMQDVRAIVTGGASGLGRAVADSVIAAGGRATLLDVNDDAGQAAVAELGTAAHFFRTDVTQESGVDEAVRAAADAMGGITLAVNCAGVGWPRQSAPSCELRSWECTYRMPASARSVARERCWMRPAVLMLRLMMPRKTIPNTSRTPSTINAMISVCPDSRPRDSLRMVALIALP